MSNVIEFIIRMKNGASAPMAAVAKDTNTANAAFTKITASNKQFQAVVGTSGQSVNDLKTKLKSLQDMRDILPSGSEKQIKKVNSEIDQLKEKIGSIENMKSSGGGIKSYLTDLVDSIPPIMKNPIVAIGAGIGLSLNQGMKNSQTKLELGNMLGANSGESLFKSLNGVKAQFGEETFNFGKSLINSGYAVDKIVPKLNSFGDVANGNKEKIGGFVEAFSEMRVENKFTEESFKKLALLGFNPLNQMSKQTGVSVETLTKKMQEGKISVAEIDKALEGATSKGGQFYGNMDRINNSPMGKWNLMIAKVTQFASVIGEYLMPIVTTVIGYAVDVFGWLAAKIESVVEWMKPLVTWAAKNKDMIGLLTSVLAGLVIGIYAVTAAKTVWIAITGALTTAFEVMSVAIMSIPVIGWIIAGIAAIIAAIMYLRSHFTGFGKFFTNLWTIAKANWTYFVAGIKSGFESIWYYMQVAWLKIKSFGQYISELFNNIGEAIKLALQFKFDDAKAKLTAEITTSASKELTVLEKDHNAKQEGYAKEQLAAFKTITETPLKGLIKRKEEEDPNNATNSAFGDMSQSQMVSAKHDEKISEGINAISGGGVKNITVTVGKMIENSYITMTQETKQAALDLERLIEEGMVRAITSASAR